MSNGTRRAVAVTGIGAVTPAGAGVDRLWDLLVSGRSAARTVDELVEHGMPVTIAALVPDGPDGLGAPSLLSGKAARRADRFTQLAAIAAREALASADLFTSGSVDPARAGVVVGTGIGGISTTFAEGTKHLSGKPTNPLVVPMVMPNAASANIAMQTGWTGPNLTLATACASGAHAIGEAANVVSRGDADVALAGGAEAAVHPFVVQAFADLTALSTRNDAPERASRPFDVDRDGFVMGEGAAFVVLEAFDVALARGAEVYALVLGYGRNTDAYHLVMPEPEGRGAAACMALALAEARLSPDAIGSISAHGTGTPYNDVAEANALHTVFGTNVPPVTATKGAVGHLIGAAGAVQAVAAVLSLHHGVLPPTANLERLDPEVNLDVVAEQPRPIGPSPILSNSFAFGGHNASLVLGPPPT